MFFIPDLLQKRGPWALVWMAGTYPNKTQNRYLQNASVHQICKEINDSEVPLSLRLSSFLMSGIVYIYHHQSQKLYQDTISCMRQGSSNFLPQLKRKTRISAKYSEITLRRTEDEFSQPISSIWEDISDFRDLDTIAYPSQNTSETAPIHQASVEDITLPDIELQNIELNLEADDYNFQIPQDYVNFGDQHNIIPDDNLIYSPNTPDMFRSPQQHQIEHVIPIPHDVVEEPLDIINQEESNIRDEDNQFVNSNVNQKKHGHNISIRIDRRISMGSDEMREIIENTDEIEINRPIYEPISNQPNFYEPSIPSNTCNALKEVWNFFTFEIGYDDTYSVSSSTPNPMPTDFDYADNPITSFLSEFGDDPITVDRMKHNTIEETLEYRKASMALSTPQYQEDYLMQPDTPLYHQSPSKESPLPQRRASSIHPVTPFSPLYSEPQYFEHQELPTPIIPEALELQELVTSIDENSVKMLKYVNSKLKNQMHVEFEDITNNMNRNQAAKSFYQILVLASTGYLSVVQTSAYDNITIREGDLQSSTLLF